MIARKFSVCNDKQNPATCLRFNAVPKFRPVRPKVRRCIITRLPFKCRDLCFFRGRSRYPVAQPHLRPRIDIVKIVHDASIECPHVRSSGLSLGIVQTRTCRVDAVPKSAIPVHTNTKALRRIFCAFCGRLCCCGLLCDLFELFFAFCRDRVFLFRPFRGDFRKRSVFCVRNFFYRCVRRLRTSIFYCLHCICFSRFNGCERRI